MRYTASSSTGFAVLLLALSLASPMVQANCAPLGGGALSLSSSASSAGPLAQDPPPPATPDAAPVDAMSEARQALAAIGRLEDADTALALAAEGAALYEREAVKLDGYAYCSQAVELAEKGEFRESTRAASKALHVALQTGNVDLLGKAIGPLQGVCPLSTVPP